MSDLSVMDYFLTKNEYKVSEMDISSSYDNAELMSSDFFDSILSLERDHASDSQFDSNLFSLNEDNKGTVSDGSLTFDDIQCETSTFSDSGLSSDLQEISDQVLSDEEILKSILDTSVPATTVKPPSKPIEYVRPIEISARNGQVHAIPSTAINIKKGTVIKQKSINIIKPNQKTKQVIRVQPLNGNSRSVLLPINIKDLKTIKIINPNDFMTENLKLTSGKLPKKKLSDEEFILSTPKFETVNSSNIELSIEDQVDLDTESISVDSNDEYPLLSLTAEEKRLLNKDGIHLPTRYPLTKSEERELKRIRRKIRNKISAQDSRKRKKEYVDGLEERVKQCSEENRSLLKRIKLLQTQNTKLSSQLSKLQALVFKTGTSRAHPATCLMIVMLSVMLVTLPNLRNLSDSNNKDINTLQQYVARRALLFSQQATNEDISLNMDDTFSSLPPYRQQNADADCINDTEPAVSTSTTASAYIENQRKSYRQETTVKYTMDDPTINKNRKTTPFDYAIQGQSPRKYEFASEGFCVKRLIEPDIDDHWPPKKKSKIDLTENISISATNYLPNNRTHYLE